MTISNLIGKTISEINRNDCDITFHFTNGGISKMTPAGDRVSVSLDIAGDLDDLVNSPIVEAYKSTNSPKDGATHTFYIFRTFKGNVTLCWKCSSNGYYSEEVNFKCIEEGIEISDTKHSFAYAKEIIETFFQEDNLIFYRHDSDLEMVFDDDKSEHKIPLTTLNDILEQLKITSDQLIIEEDSDGLSIRFKEILEWIN